MTIGLRRCVSLGGIRAAAAAALVAGFVCSSFAQESLVDVDSFRAGCRSLEDGRFATAVRQLETTWEQLIALDAGGIERDFVASRLLEAMVKNGDTRAAVEWIDEHASVNASPETLRWKALALQAEGRYSEAALAFDTVRASLPRPHHDLQLAHALCLARTNQAERALEILGDSFVADSREEAFQLAFIASEAGQMERALRVLQDSSSEGGDPETRWSLPHIRLEITLLLRLDRSKEAIALAMDRIDRARREEEVLESFLLLEETGVASTYPPLRSRMGDWAENREHPASAGSRFFSPLLLEPDEDPSAFLEKTARDDRDSVYGREARLRLLRHSKEENAELVPPKISAGDEIRSVHERAARAFDQRRYRDAAERFARLARLQTGTNRSLSLYNSALSELEADDYESFSTVVDRLRALDPSTPLLGDLEYIGGLHLAARGDAKAFPLLQRFVRDRPDHRHEVDARIALAESHLNQVPARPQAAREVLDDLRIRPLTLRQNERLDYTSVWLEWIDGSSPSFVEAADDFLSDWPNSQYQPKVRMLLARYRYERGEFAEARKLFTELVSRFPDSDFAAPARFFGVKATGDPEAAEEGWRKIIARNGEQTTRAHQELGLLLLSQDRFEEARSEFEAVLGAVDDDDPIRFAALGDIGFSHYLEAIDNEGDPEGFERASDVFARLARIPDAPRRWIYDASVRRGKCLEALGRTEVALEIYRSLVTGADRESTLLTNVSSPEATIWIFRAGFAAIKILEQREDWQAAIRIADELSREDGPRAIKASRLAERMRLEHWVWD